MSNSCLRDKVFICCQIFVKLAQFVYLINSFNAIVFEKNLTNSMGKVAISSLKFTFLAYAIVFILGQISMKLAEFVYLINNLNPIDFEKIPTKSMGKVAIST